MSLIQEALKRQQEELGVQEGVQPPEKGKSPPPPPPPPLTPRAASTQPPRPPKKGKSSRLPAVLGVFVVLALLIGGAIALICFAIEAAKRQPKTTNGTNESHVAIADVNPGDLPPIEPEETNTVEVPPTPADPDALVSTGQNTQKLVDVAIEEPPAEPTVEVATPSEPVEWPVLTVEGVVGKGDRGAARINGQVVFVGDLIEGVRVISIHADPNKAELEYEGDRRFVRVGSSTQ